MRDYILVLVDMLLKFKLTANQFIFLFLKVYQVDEKLYKYLETTRPLSRDELFDLEERGFIININQSANDYWADGYIVSKRFIIMLNPASLQAEEFWDTYPGFYQGEHQKLPLKGIQKDYFLNHYASTVLEVPNLHERIMRALRFQKGKEDIKQRIDTWFEAKTWERIEQEIDQIRKKMNGQI